MTLLGIPVGKIIVWLIVGALAGTFTGMLLTRSKEGYGRWTNLGIGLVGALIGGGLFHVLGIDLKLGDIKVTIQDLISAFIGSLIFMIAIAIFRRSRRQKTE